MRQVHIDVLTATAAELQSLLEDGKISSLDLVEIYLDQIEKHNHRGMKLHAIIEIAPKPDVIERARQLDQERKVNGPRGAMHGIPVIVKVWSNYSFAQ